MPQTYLQFQLGLATALAGFLDPDEARAECFRWFEEGLGLSRSWMVMHGTEEVPAGVRRKVNSWLRRRRQGEPWAYLLGWSLFRDRRFTVNTDTLIPRPETELLVEAALEVGLRLKLDHCVDIGTGSGIIAVSLALETNWKISASDQSRRALAVARKNAMRYGAEIVFYEGNLLDPVPDPVGLVVANLPYVDPADQSILQRELDFEPPSALFAPDGGLALTTALLHQAHARQSPACLLEIGAHQGGELCRRAMGIGWRKVMIHQDIAGHDRILVALS
jgi:release factor glutamine methyltransferase